VGAGDPALGDEQVRLTPLTDRTIRELVAALAAFPLLGEFGREALEDALARVSALVEGHPEVGDMLLDASGARVRVEPREPELPAGTLGRRP
jgi:hypothetical protein